MCPADIKQNNSLQAFNILYKDLIQYKKPKFKVGDAVRIAKEKRTFEKGYEYRFHEQIFFVDKVIRHSVPIYVLKDERGDKSENPSMPINAFQLSTTLFTGRKPIQQASCSEV